MRSYTNRNGETVTVSEEHLNTAVELKELLQKDSPSHRCSWAQHRRLMIAEGFDDSENSESYRQMIKSYQKSIGKLPTAEEHAEKVHTSKLNSYKELVGEVAWHKRESQNYLRQINKGKRQIVDGSLFIQEVSEAVHDALQSLDVESLALPALSPSDVGLQGTRMILCLTDWHIGAIVDVEDNQYNFSVAKQRIADVIAEAKRLARFNNVKRIDVVYQGDMLEHAYMRDAQAYSAEFPVSRQMALGGRLIIEVLHNLARDFIVTYRGFAGNHDRLNKDKNGNIDGDTGMVVVNEMVELYIETVANDRLTYHECHNYSARMVNVNGRNFRFEHGDLLKKADTGKLADRSSVDKIHYDAIVYGHFHHFACFEVGIDKYEIRVGSLKGADEYSEKLGLGSTPSQVAILVSRSGEIDVKKITVN